MGATTLSRLAAWPGLVPRQATTDGKPKLLGITKRGSKYLHKLIIRAGYGNTRVSMPVEISPEVPVENSSLRFVIRLY